MAKPWAHFLPKSFYISLSLVMNFRWIRLYIDSDLNQLQGYLRSWQPVVNICRSLDRPVMFICIGTGDIRRLWIINITPDNPSLRWSAHESYDWICARKSDPNSIGEKYTLTTICWLIKKEKKIKTKHVHILLGVLYNLTNAHCAAHIE